MDDRGGSDAGAGGDRDVVGDRHAPRLARTEAWRQELARARPLIARRVADLVGQDVVRRIAIAVVPEQRLASNVVPPSRG